MPPEDPPLERIASEAIGEIVLALTTTGYREDVLRRRAPNPKKCGAAEFADHLVAAHVFSITGRKYDPADSTDADELRKLWVPLTEAERRQFATAYLKENHHLLCKMKFVDDPSESVIKRKRIEYEPRNDVTWAEDPVARLHQAWIIEDEERERIGRRGLGVFGQIEALGRQPRAVSDVLRAASLVDSQGGAVSNVLRVASSLDKSLAAASIAKATEVGALFDWATRFLPEKTFPWLKKDISTWERLTGASASPFASSAFEIYGKSTTSLVSALSAKNLLKNELFASQLLRPSRVFTNYVDETLNIAGKSGSHVNDILKGIIGFSEEHYGKGTTIASRMIESVDVGEHQEEVESPAEAHLLLLTRHRDEILAKVVQFPDADAVTLLGLSVITPIANSVREMIELVLECNEAARVRGRDPIFKSTDGVVRATLYLPQLLPEDRQTLGDAIDHLYVVIYEGAGGANLRYSKDKRPDGFFERDDPAIAPVFHLKTLRTALRHDVDHGSEKEVKSKWTDRGETLRLLGVSDMPKKAVDVQRLYSTLLGILSDFLRELLARIQAIQPLH